MTNLAWIFFCAEITVMYVTIYAEQKLIAYRYMSNWVYVWNNQNASKSMPAFVKNQANNEKGHFQGRSTSNKSHTEEQR